MRHGKVGGCRGREGCGRGEIGVCYGMLAGGREVGMRYGENIEREVGAGGRGKGEGGGGRMYEEDRTETWGVGGRGRAR